MRYDETILAGIAKSGRCISFWGNKSRGMRMRHGGIRDLSMESLIAAD